MLFFLDLLEAQRILVRIFTLKKFEGQPIYLQMNPLKIL